MNAPQACPAAAGPGHPGRPARVLAHAYAALWAATAAGLLLGLAGVTVTTVPAPRDAIDANVGSALELAAHNLPVVLWPLALAAIGWHQHRSTRTVGDVLVGGQFLVHGLLVGGAIAQHAAMWRYLPHLPVEWLALAAGAAGWWSARRSPRRPSVQLAQLAAVAIVATVAAAALETWAVPL